jgi:hypothetical protein
MHHNKANDSSLSSSESSGSDTEMFDAQPQPQPPVHVSPPIKKDLHKLERSTTERALPHVTPPRSFVLKHEELFDPKTNLPNLDLLKQHLIEEGKLLKEDVLEIVNRTTQLFVEEPNILIVKEPVTSTTSSHKSVEFNLVNFQLENYIKNNIKNNF